jgi:monothiol glutaredoxin
VRGEAAHSTNAKVFVFHGSFVSPINSDHCSIEVVFPPTLLMTPDVENRIKELLESNKIMIFMKGTKLMPQCGFSNNVVQIFNILGVPFETYDILADSEIRQGIKDFSNWPTIPQVYINGEFIGGSDIMIELYQKGELQQMVEVALAS